MRKHAFLIIAHKEIDQLNSLIKALDNERNDIFINLDPKDQPYVYKVKKANLFFNNFIPGKWGGFSLVKIELSLLELANKNRAYDFYHLLSGQDYPLKPLPSIYNFFDNHQNTNFIEVNDNLKLENPERFNLRYQQYHFLQDKFGMKKRSFLKYLDFGSCLLQKCVGIKRSNNITIKSGSQWFSITKPLVDFILQNKNKIFYIFKNTYCPDELFIQTIIWDSKFMKTLFNKGKKHSNLRYYNFQWIEKHVLTPKILDESDLPDIKQTNALFGRKFSIPKSQKLEQLLLK